MSKFIPNIANLKEIVQVSKSRDGITSDLNLNLCDELFENKFRIKRDVILNEIEEKIVILKGFCKSYPAEDFDIINTEKITKHISKHNFVIMFTKQQLEMNKHLEYHEFV